MRFLRSILTVVVSLPCALLAQDAGIGEGPQKWEVGGSAGYGLYRNVSVSGPATSGKTGFESGYAAGGVFGNDLYRFVGGELRYTFRSDDLRVSSGSSKATFGGQSHAFHYDALFHAASKNAPVRPFLAVGGGVKFYRGTGAEQVFQPLSNLVVLTKSSQVEPLVSAGGGIKFQLSHHALFRVDVRDYMTPRPDKLLALPANTRSSGWLHDFVVLVGFSTTFSKVSM